MNENVNNKVHVSKIKRGKIMKKYAFLGVLLISMGVFATVSAQTYIDVEPDNYPLEVGSLNNAIENHGADGVIFRLKRGEVYWNDARIRPLDYHLVIEAEEGDGPRPMIRTAVDETGSDVGRWMQAEGSGLTLRGIYLCGLDEEFNMTGQMQIREKMAVYLDDVMYEYADQSLLRHNVDSVSYYITNSYIRKVGREQDPNNGRIIDTRGNHTDSLVIINSTLSDFTHYGFWTWGSVTNYVKLDHNTIIDGGLGLDISLVKEAVITNNLITSVGWRGNPATLESGMDDHAIFTFVSADPTEFYNDADRSIVFRNNNIGGMKSSYIDLLEKYWEPGMATNPSGQPTNRLFIHDMIIDSTGLDLLDKGIIVMEDNFTESEGPEGLVFSSRTDLNLLLTYYEQYVGGANEFSEMFDRTETGIGENTWSDLSYNQNAISFTGAEKRYPVGNLNYWPQEYIDSWLAGLDAPNLTHSEIIMHQPEEFLLINAYPNPFNPTTNISYVLPNSTDVVLEVYNVVGSRVLRLEEGVKPVGEHTVLIDGSKLTSGIYVVRLVAGNDIKTTKITLIK